MISPLRALGHQMRDRLEVVVVEPAVLQRRRDATDRGAGGDRPDADRAAQPREDDRRRGHRTRRRGRLRIDALVGRDLGLPADGPDDHRPVGDLELLLVARVLDQLQRVPGDVGLGEAEEIQPAPGHLGHETPPPFGVRAFRPPFCARRQAGVEGARPRQTPAPASSRSRSPKSSAASSAMTGIASRSRSSCASGAAAGSAEQVERRAGRRRASAGAPGTTGGGTASGPAGGSRSGGRGSRSPGCAPSRSPGSGPRGRVIIRSRTTLATTDAQAIE